MNANVDGTVTVRIVREVAELSSIREAWRSFQEHPSSDFDFYTTYLARKDDFVRPHVLLLERDHQPIAVVAGSIQRDSLRWRIGSMRLGQSRARVLRVGGGGAMGESSEAVARAVTGEILATLSRGEADAAYVHQIDSASALSRSLQGVPELSRDRFVRPVGGWELELPETFSAYLSSRTKNTRKNLKRYSSLLEKELAGDFTIACHREPGDLERLVRDTESVARLTYHRRIGVGFEDKPSERRLLAHVLGAALFRGYTLYAKDRPIAFWHGLSYGRTFYTGHTGFDPAFARLRPGHYLLNRIIEEHCRTRETVRIDYGMMDLDYKRQFGTRRYERSSIYVFSRRPRGFFLSTLRTGTGMMDRGARWLLGSRARQWGRRLGSFGRRRSAGEEKAPDDEERTTADDGDGPTS